MNERKRDLLFSKYDLRNVLEGQLASVSERVLKVDDREFQQLSNELIAARIASELVVSPLRLLEDKIQVSSSDAKVDVSNDFNRAISDRSRPLYIDGIEVQYVVPFSGDKELWHCRPGTFTLNPPQAIVTASELLFPFRRPDRDVASTKPKFLADLAHVKEWLPRVNQQVDMYNTVLETRVRERVLQRRGDLDRTKVDLAALGFPVRQDAHQRKTPEAPEATPLRREATRKKARRSYDVALSFAGEDREYVERVAEELRRLEVTVFYDKFEQVNLWGRDLAEHLGEVYSKDSRFVVIFASNSYAAKAWPNHEKQFALGRHLSGDKGRILPVRFDDTEIPGIPSTMAYLDLRVLTPEKLAELIRQKVDADPGQS